MRGYFRRLFAWEHERFARHLIRMSPEDRRRRFLGATSESYLRRHAKRALHSHRVLVIGWFFEGTLRGVAELAFQRERLRATVEAAFTVEADFRRAGIGSALMERALRAARNRGLHGLLVVTEAGNVPMIRLARRFGGEFCYDSGDVEVTIPMRPATQFSLISEIQEEESGMLASFLAGWHDRWRGVLLPFLGTRGPGG